jgi:hypothetical protein
MTCRESPRIVRLLQFWSCLVALGLVRALGDAVEVGEEIGREVALVMLAFLGLLQQIVDECLRMNFFLNVKWRGVDDEVAPILFILPAPDELGAEVGIARGADGLRLLVLCLDDGLLLGGGNVFALRLVVLEGLDGLVSGRLFLGGHRSGMWNQARGLRMELAVRMLLSRGLMK